MAEPTANPPRPRPRPRPVIKHASVPSAADASSSSSSAIPDAARRVVEVHDTDEMFMRNRNRSIQTWHKLDEIDRAVAKPDKEGSSGSDDDDSPRKSKHKRKKREISAVPAWQKNKNFTRLLSKDLSSGSDSDSDIEVVGGSSTPSGKRKRKQRSRSRSITPPPALPEYQIQAAKNVVRQTLGASLIRAPSPTYFDPDESADTIVFQPELDAIDQEINAHRESSQAPETTDAVQDHVVLTVIWHPHPLNPYAQKAEWQYRINRHDNFRELFDATADDANILTDNLVITYQGKRLFPSVSPAFLKIYADTAELAAYEKQAYDYIHKNTNALQHANAPASPVHVQPDGSIEIGSDEEAEDNEYVSQTQIQTQDSEAESEAEGETQTFKLILRSAGNKDISLTVRPTTKCGAIVKAFLKKLGIDEQYPEVFADAPAKPAAKKRGRQTKAVAAAAAKDPRLCIDGDKMDNQTPIGDMDLEDGDMVEVVGL